MEISATAEHELVLSTPPQFAVSQPLTVADEVVSVLSDLGVRTAFGLCGGAVAGLYNSLRHSDVEIIHCRHEAGSVFAATEYYFASGRPAVIFSTSGPGITNALTGLFAARWEGAKLIFVSAATPTSQIGRWAFQETSDRTMPTELFAAGPLFHYAVRLESAEQLPEVAAQLFEGLARPGGFVAHVSIPTIVQTSTSTSSLPAIYERPRANEAEAETLARCAAILGEERFAIWLGFGARGAAGAVRELAEKTGAAVMCSPRAKGIFPETHPQFIGSTGFGGHDSVLDYMREFRPDRILVLGSRLGEFTSFWSHELVPAKGFIHVDIDETVFGAAYPDAETLPVQSEVESFVSAMLDALPSRTASEAAPKLPKPSVERTTQRDSGAVRHAVLMDAIQRVVVEGSDSVVMTEAGNAFAWGTHSLRFDEPGRYRVSTGFGSMGHAVTGVLGAAIGRGGKAVAIAGDGAMLMNNEISTAVHYGAPAVWIVLNDSGYGMIDHGMRLHGYEGWDMQIPRADFVSIARAMGADGVAVEHETELEAALALAMSSPVPFVVDVRMDTTSVPPFGGRVRSLLAQGVKGKKIDGFGERA
ncbi:MAG TPA: thiamine pyrophosphate-binding protein [Pyrinomonadaceae bacterium]|nr:thiamine pyrophosphate-binding protein [Pyrinomonadaceae bacterium]